ncbi:hypothetical protein GCM10010216_53840 [Streptomyces flaveolus]|nr:hypothetical protein GCM10010216_53840 [Streptomyces flaveolus]
MSEAGRQSPPQADDRRCGMAARLTRGHGGAERSRQRAMAEARTRYGHGHKQDAADEDAHLEKPVLRRLSRVWRSPEPSKTIRAMRRWRDRPSTERGMRPALRFLKAQEWGAGQGVRATARPRGPM